ncbi:MAG: transposase zinc-binding domain-containing protein [Nanoarchaeota archaeon]|nr:transposase zinc-binding domain-containing protein [Nanoarchaeota archaeon]
MYSVAQIIRENWKEYLKNNRVLSYQKAEMEKMINCSKNSCNSRICSSCGKRYADDWSRNLKLNHFNKHVVFTVPAYLRHIFRDWNNLSILMRSSRDFLKNFI